MKAAKKAGYELARIEIDADDKIVIVPGKPAEPIAESSTELDNWIAKQNARQTQGY